MERTFEFREMEVTAYWNEKTYADGSRYVHAKHGYQSARGTYNANSRRWTKSVGNEAYNNAIAKALGWEKIANA